jgi:hypothetical protein
MPWRGSPNHTHKSSTPHQRLSSGGPCATAMTEHAYARVCQCDPAVGAVALCCWHMPLRSSLMASCVVCISARQTVLHPHHSVPDSISHLTRAHLRSDYARHALELATAAHSGMLSFSCSVASNTNTACNADMTLLTACTININI